MAEVRITLDPAELANPRLEDWSQDGGEGLVRIGHNARCWVTADQALEIAEAWRRIELALIEHAHGAGVVHAVSVDGGGT